MKYPITAISSCALAAALALSTLTPAVSADESNKTVATSSYSWYSLVGAWTSEVTHVDCTSGSLANPPPFRAQETFDLGGTYTQFGAAFGNRRSTGFGTWQRTGRDTFAASFSFFRFDDASGYIPIAVVRIERQITVTGPNSLLSTNRSIITTLDGAFLSKACSTEVGTRL